MTIRRAMSYAVLAVAGILACYVVAFHGFDAVAKGVMLQMQAQDGGRLHGAGPAASLTAPFL